MVSRQSRQSGVPPNKDTPQNDSGNELRIARAPVEVFLFAGASSSEVEADTACVTVPYPCRASLMREEQNDKQNMAVGQNLTTRGPQVLVHGSIHQGSILGTYF